jgi:hypothetical protein
VPCHLPCLLARGSSLCQARIWLWTLWGADPQWPGQYPWLTETRRDSRFRGRLERAEATHRGAAARLRAMGLDDLAHRAEQFAAWVRFDLDEPQAARRLYAATGGLRGLSPPRLLFGKVLGGRCCCAEPIEATSSS